MSSAGIVEADPLEWSKVKPFMLVACAFLAALFRGRVSQRLVPDRVHRRPRERTLEKGQVRVHLGAKVDGYRRKWTVIAARRPSPRDAQHRAPLCSRGVGRTSRGAARGGAPHGHDAHKA